MIFTSGLSVPEGPVCLPDKSWLCVEMGAGRGCVTHVSADGKTKRVVAQTGRPNGLAVDRAGNIWVAESSEPALLRLRLDGTCEVFLKDCNGLPFMFPNDLCFGPDGLLYLTDSGIYVEDFAPGGQIRPDYALAQTVGRVYQINTQTREIAMVDRGIRFTNGIAIGPERNLYVNETLTGFVYRYELRGGQVGRRQYFGDVVDPHAAPGYKGPDGMKFGLDGHLYVTVYGQQDVTVLGPTGSVVRRMRTLGKNPTNVAFGLPPENKIYVTEVELGQIEVHDVDTAGLPLYS